MLTQERLTRQGWVMPWSWGRNPRKKVIMPAGGEPTRSLPLRDGGGGHECKSTAEEERWWGGKDQVDLRGEVADSRRKGGGSGDGRRAGAATRGHGLDEDVEGRRRNLITPGWERYWPVSYTVGLDYRWAETNRI
uniref:Uncharacterized protein n=1 Tax=Arundo donax TaxID=35708 RepID=A0A0A8ZKB3_ARUDO